MNKFAVSGEIRARFWLIIFDAALKTSSVNEDVAGICSIISAKFQLSGYFVQFTDHHGSGQSNSIVSCLVREVWIATHLFWCF